MSAAKHKRKSLSVKSRFEVFKRDSFTCQYCGSHPPQAKLHVDHIIAVAEGGGNEQDNLVTACDRCNLGKGARPLTDIPEALANRVTDTVEREEQIRGYAEIMAAKRERIDADCRHVLKLYADHFAIKSIREDWFLSTCRFVTQLDVYDAMEAMEIAVMRCPNDEYGCFKYFCGVCWSKIRENADEG